jgi:hypothetical protein
MIHIGEITHCECVYLQEDDVRVMACYEIGNRLHPSIHRNVLIAPDVVGHELDLPICIGGRH